MDREFSVILKEIGCTDGLHVPVANKENKSLQNKVEDKLRYKADLIMNLEFQHDQLNRIQNQIKNLIVQKEQNQQLIAAHCNQHKTELRMLKESEFILSKTKHDIISLKKEINNSHQNHDMLQEEIKQSMKNVNHLKALVEWGEEARQAWHEELVLGERDNNLLERFKLEDDIKFKEMELKRQRFKTDVMELEAILSNELNMLTTLENQLEQVSRLFRRAHNERMNLILYWENAVKILYQREKNIDLTFQEMQRLKELGQKKFSALAEERKFYDTQCENNKELSLELFELNSKTIRQRQMSLELTSDTTNLKNEVTTIRGVMSELSTAINKERCQNTYLTSELQAKTAYLFTLHQPIADLRTRLQELSESDLTTAQRTTEINKVLHVSKRNNSLLDTKLDKLKENVFEKNHELETLRSTSKLMGNELKILDMNKQAFGKTTAELEKEVINKEQTLYDLDIEMVSLENKLARLQGERTDEEKMAYKIKVLKLEEALQKRTEVLNLVNFQYNKANNEQLIISDNIDEESEQLYARSEKRKELMFLVEGGQKELIMIQNSNKNLQVTFSMLHLRVDQRKNTLAKHDSEVFNLEKEQLELEKALCERKIEIELHMDMMSAKKRTLEEEKSKLKKALEYIHIRASQLQKKYDIVMDSMGKEDNEDHFSVTHFTIKMAQEKHELQEIGDDLDSKIKKAENEIPAMENTLRVISAANDCYKYNLDSIDSNSPEMQEKITLVEELEHAKINLEEQQSELKQINSQIHELEYSLSDLVECEEQVRLEWKNRDVAARSLDKEMEDQQSKVVRAEKLLRKLKREARQMKEPRVALYLAEKDIDLRELQDINQSALQQLAELSTRYSEIGPLLNRYLGEKGLCLPVVRTGTINDHGKVSCGSTLSTQRSILSEDSHISWGSGPSSQFPSTVVLHPDTIQPAFEITGGCKQSRIPASRKK